MCLKQSVGHSKKNIMQDYLPLFTVQRSSCYPGRHLPYCCHPGHEKGMWAAGPSPAPTSPAPTGSREHSAKRQTFGKLGSLGQCVTFLFKLGQKRRKEWGMFSSFLIHFPIAYLSTSLDIIVPIQELKPKYRVVLMLQNKKLNYISV